MKAETELMGPSAWGTKVANNTRNVPLTVPEGTSSPTLWRLTFSLQNWERTHVLFYVTQFVALGFGSHRILLLSSTSAKARWANSGHSAWASGITW